MKNISVLILSGPPATGKTTFARRFMKTLNNAETVRISQDDLRNMYGAYWVPEREAFVKESCKTLIKFAIMREKNVIIDCTNLGSIINMLHNLVREAERELIETKGPKYSVNISIKTFNTNYLRAIFRDWKRGLFGGRALGFKVLKKTFKNFYH